MTNYLLFQNPFKDLELYAIPAIIAAVAWLASAILDKTCSHQICEVPTNTQNNYVTDVNLFISI